MTEKLWFWTLEVTRMCWYKGLHRKEGSRCNDWRICTARSQHFEYRTLCMLCGQWLSISTRRDMRVNVHNDGTYLPQCKRLSKQDNGVKHNGRPKQKWRDISYRIFLLILMSDLNKNANKVTWSLRFWTLDEMKFIRWQHKHIQYIRTCSLKKIAYRPQYYYMHYSDFTRLWFTKTGSRSGL